MLCFGTTGQRGEWLWLVPEKLLLLLWHYTHSLDWIMKCHNFLQRSETESHKNRRTGTHWLSIHRHQVYKHTCAVNTRTTRRCVCLLCSRFEFAWSNWRKWERNFEDTEQRKPPLLAIIWRHSSLCPQNIARSQFCPCLLLKRAQHSWICPCELSNLDYLLNLLTARFLIYPEMWIYPKKQISSALASVFGLQYICSCESPHPIWEY